MKIREIKAFAIKEMTAGGMYSASAPRGMKPRRPPWTRTPRSPIVPLAAVTGYPGMTAPVDGRLRPSDAPGFELSLEQVEALAV